MENEIYQILKKHKLPLKKREEVLTDLLLLFSVSCQRKLFIAMIDKMKESDWQEADNGFAGRVFDRLNGNK
jgi:hypothetical protein